MENNNNILELIGDLKQYDNEKGYKLEYKEVKEKFDATVSEIINSGENAVEYLHPLLEDEKTWSCLFALEILKGVKSEKSIPYLVSFIKRTDESDYWESGEGAMYALTAIGKPAVQPLLEEVRKSFINKKDYTYLTGALTEIEDANVYKFMIEITEDYIKNYKKYDGWFAIHMFTMDFDKQKNKEALPVLGLLYPMKHLSKEEKREIESTIEVLKDPEKYDEKLKRDMQDFKEKSDEFKKDYNKLFGNYKLNNREKEEFHERENDADNNFETNFICDDCKERQNIKTGQIYYVDSTRKKNQFLFEWEIMCKHCHSHNIVLSKTGEMELFGKHMRMFVGNDKGILNIGKYVMIENKKMRYDEAYDYMLKRIEEEPENGEIYLRAGNNAQKFNKHDEAIKFYEKSIEFNPKLIASYLNLLKIYIVRFDYYGIEEDGDKTIDYFSKAVKIFNSHDYNTATISHESYVEDFIIDSGRKLGLDINIGKVGRNDQCPCGSGKKYKKCCMNKNSGNN